MRKVKRSGNPAQSSGATSHPRKPTQTTGSGNREPRGFHAARSYWDTYRGPGEKGKAASPGSEPRQGCLEVSTVSGRSQTGTDDLQEASHQEKHARSLGGITADESKENIPHDCLESLLAQPGWGSPAAPVNVHSKRTKLRVCLCAPSNTDQPAPQPCSLGCCMLFQATSHPQQFWVLRKPFGGQKGVDPGHMKHFLT